MLFATSELIFKFFLGTATLQICLQYMFSIVLRINSILWTHSSVRFWEYSLVLFKNNLNLSLSCCILTFSVKPKSKLLARRLKKFHLNCYEFLASPRSHERLSTNVRAACIVWKYSRVLFSRTFAVCILWISQQLKCYDRLRTQFITSELRNQFMV